MGKEGLNFLLDKGLKWENNAKWLREKYEKIFHAEKSHCH